MHAFVPIDEDYINVISLYKVDLGYEFLLYFDYGQIICMLHRGG